MMKNGKYQIKDISDKEIYDAIKRRSKTARDFFQISIYDTLSYYPSNLITAKLNKMVEQGKIDYGVSIAYPFIV